MWSSILLIYHCAVRSKLWKQAGKTDYTKTLQDALEQASKQSAQLAESLQEAAQRGSQPPDVLARGLQEGRQTAQAMAEQLQGQLQGANIAKGARHQYLQVTFLGPLHQCQTLGPFHAGVLKDGERLFNDTVRGTGPLQDRLQQVHH